jgi:DNA-binding PadR family transcriptional regulator
MFGKRHDYKGCRISPMQLVILLVLKERPMYGYEVLKALRDHFEGVWTPQTGSIYPALKRLVESGLVASEQRDGTDYYSLTSEGAEWVQETLRRSPRDIRFLAKYLELMDRTANMLHIEGEESPGKFSEIFESDEDMDRAKRVKKLRHAREHIARHLADIDRELRDLEVDRKEEGGVQ